MANRDKEFRYTDANFEFISKLAYKHSGIVLADHKKDMVYSRLTRRLRALRLADFDAYCNYVQNHEDLELTEFINALTTNLTSFFREQHHFDFLTDTAIPELRKEHLKDKRLRIWSAGCSTGMEPYSIALTLFEAFPLSVWDLKILATDLDSNVLETGKRGVYRYEDVDVEGIPKTALHEYFEQDTQHQQVRVKPEIKKLIHFKQLNLLKAWPMKGPFDIIFCRNVVIYFDQETKKALFDRYANLLKPNGILILGHSESLQNLTDRFEGIGRTIYRKIK